MSKAFVNEDAAAAAAPVQPGRPARPQPITPRGHRRLHEERAALAHDDPARARLDRVLATVEVIAPRLVNEGAGFGCEIDVEDEQGRRRTFALVGPDEVDAPAGLITADTPAGRALLGARAGDQVRLPRGEVTVLAVRLLD